MQEEVRSHDGGDGPQVHAVAPLTEDHLTEKLQQRLDTQLIALQDTVFLKNSKEERKTQSWTII